jgi:uncharacterized membrane protein
MRLPLLVLHVSGGIIGLLSGTMAMIYRKGSRRHARAGKVFVIAMIVMGVCGSVLALMKHQMNNVSGGILTVYMVATSWATVRRRDGGTSPWDWVAVAGALSVAGTIGTLGLVVVRNPTAFGDGVPAAMYFVMGSIALLCAAGDVRMLMRGGVAGTQRLVRHLWRMCFALFIATGSFFLGQQQVFPEWMRGWTLWTVVGLAPLPLLIFWLGRVWFTNRNKGRSAAKAADTYSLSS